MQLSTREPPRTRKGVSRWTTSELKRHEPTSTVRGIVHVRGCTSAGLSSEVFRYWAGVIGPWTIKAALSGSTSKAPGFAGGYLLATARLICSPCTSLHKRCSFPPSALHICLDCCGLPRLGFRGQISLLRLARRSHRENLGLIVDDQLRVMTEVEIVVGHVTRT